MIEKIIIIGVINIFKRDKNDKIWKKFSKQA